MELSKYVLVVLFLAITCLCQFSWAGNLDYEEAVRGQCGYTRYPTLCGQTLSQLGSKDRNVDFLTLLVNETISQVKMPELVSLATTSISADSQLIQTAMDYCHELMEMSLKRLNQAMEAIKKSPKTEKSDIQTWLSAALTFQETCRDEIKDHATTDSYTAEIYNKIDHLSKLASNSLALANRIAAQPAGRRLLLQAGDFPAWVSPANRKLLQSSAGAVRADAVVAKDGSGNFKSVGEAINAASGGRFVIYVKAGTYNEKITISKDGITLIGDGKYATIISAGSSVAKGSSLKGSATFTVRGDGFIARDIGFENTAGAEGHQAVALNIASDRSVLYRCSVAGYQDTLYAHSLRQFYRECDVHGTIDYIFGNAAAVLQSCNLVFRSPRSGASFSTILANGRTDPGQNTGFSVQNSRITVGSDFSSSGKKSFALYLGRPWKAYSRAVVMQSNIAGQVSPRGWVEWEGSSGSTYKTLYFAEYGNMGAGAATSGRVGWPGFHVMATPEASKFTVASFIGGTSWLPSAGVPFDAGL
ncbi:hypothetical protein SASPL_152760 [Salvia splendens]|uniref:Pectinesterase n=1 Tax=Salvia splendens TaxID=180675 RepID=A0A8X8Z148_SALSN|nr:pectinesterase-like [Salvia splendens]KAG6387568.1 hypothetical protein SASPL_152760 [Salvia splendens]